MMSETDVHVGEVLVYLLLRERGRSRAAARLMAREIMNDLVGQPIAGTDLFEIVDAT